VGEACGTHERQKKKVCKVLVGQPEGKRPLGKPRRRKEEGIRVTWKVQCLFSENTTSMSMACYVLTTEIIFVCGRKFYAMKTSFAV
jgi:hypothetical protein